MSHFAESFIEHYSIDTPVQELWNVFKRKCHDCLDHVPSILTSKSNKNPWTNHYIKCLTNKMQHLYNQAKASQLQPDWSFYNEIKKQIQRKCKKAHDKYVSDIINPDNQHSNKKSWSYIKSKKNEQFGISTLKKNHQMFTDNLTKANISNDQFSSVFIIDNDGRENIPRLKVPIFPIIQPVHIEIQGIYTLLSELARSL